VLTGTPAGRDLEMAQAVAHQSGHVLLLGLSAGGPLVGHNDMARYP
jgi:hypothetical protein